MLCMYAYLVLYNLLLIEIYMNVQFEVVLSVYVQV